MSEAVAEIANIAMARAEKRPDADPVSASTKQLFMALHGAYGNAFLSKFSTGERDEKGKDRGVRSAMQVWQSKLATYPADVIQTAASRAMDAHPEFPPSLPQFEAICRAVAPRKTFAEEQGLTRLPAPTPAPAAPVSFAERRDGRDWARRILARHEAGDKLNPTSLRFAREAMGVL